MKKKRATPSFTIAADSRVLIGVELNTEQWLTAESVESRTVSESEVQAHARAGVEVR